jgi:UDP-GlcNAc3NAcA epimerase
MKKIITIIGARPQFIKHAPLSKELEKKFNSITIHTGQHYDKKMSNLFFSELKITKPTYIFKGIEKYQTHGSQTAYMLDKIEKIFLIEKPDAVLVYGDTTSTLAGALAASKLMIPIIHVEAGLRSYNKNMPEEINRILTDHVSLIKFCPTKSSKLNLIKEGINKHIYVTGDIMRESISLVRSKLKNFVNEPYYFVTLHRPYNTDNKKRLSNILIQLNRLNHKVFLPIHPRTKSKIIYFGLKLENYPNIRFIDPVSYTESLSYQNYSNCVITDSGGIQKEAYLLKKKCITLRSETEWIETLRGGWNVLVYNNLTDIHSLVKEKTIKELYSPKIFGVGKVSEKITKILVKILNSSN